MGRGQRCPAPSSGVHEIYINSRYKLARKEKEELKKNHEPLLFVGLKSFPDSGCAPAPLIGQIGWYLICAISPEYIRRRPEYIIP